MRIRAYKARQRSYRPEDTVVTVDDVRIGGDEVMSWPAPARGDGRAVPGLRGAVKRAVQRSCAAEPSAAQLPSSFQGHGESGLRCCGARDAAQS